MNACHADLAAILPQFVLWNDQDRSARLGEIPNRPAVFLMIADDGAPIQLGITQQLRAAVQARLTECAGPRRADLAAIVQGVRYAEARDGIETRYLHWRAARVVYPKDYAAQLAFRPADFLSIDFTAAIPEFRVTQQPYQNGAEFVGPFPTRASAQEALDGMWDLFDLCRYPEQVRRAPRGTRCAYAEMGRCDAPCDGSAPIADYITRTRAAWDFASGGADTWIAQADERMGRESRALRFERAAMIKQQLVFAQRWKRDWPQARPLRHGAFLCVTRVARRATWSGYLFREGELLTIAAVRERNAGAEISSWATEIMSLAASKSSAAVATQDARRADELAALLGHVLYGGLSARCGVTWISTDTPRHQISEEIARHISRLRGEPDTIDETKIDSESATST